MKNKILVFSVLAFFLGMLVNSDAHVFGMQSGSRLMDCIQNPLSNGFELTCTDKVTATPSPTATRTRTPVPATSTHTASPSSTSAPSASMNVWHAPGAHDGLNPHEHGDAPPQWVTDWSMATFGHGLVYGGDERSAPTENTMKHQAFKGVAYRVNTKAGACFVDLYFRYHAASNPHDRSATFHSYELYMRDCQGGISFRQGVYWVGYPDFRSQRMTRLNEQAGTILSDGSGQPAPGRDQFIVGAPDVNDFANGLKDEQWYMFAGKHGGEFSVTISQATAYFEYDEHLGGFMDMDTWHLTGGKGLGRRFEISLYGVNSPVPTVQPAGWFCAPALPVQDKVEGRTHRPKWTLITSGVTSALSCPAGFLPQFTAPTFPDTGIHAGLNNTLPMKQFPGAGIVTVPN